MYSLQEGRLLTRVVYLLLAIIGILMANKYETPIPIYIVLATYLCIFLGEWSLLENSNEVFDMCTKLLNIARVVLLFQIIFLLTSFFLSIHGDYLFSRIFTIIGLAYSPILLIISLKMLFINKRNLKRNSKILNIIHLIETEGKEVIDKTDLLILEEKLDKEMIYLTDELDKLKDKFENKYNKIPRLLKKMFIFNIKSSIRIIKYEIDSSSNAISVVLYALEYFAE